MKNPLSLLLALALAAALLTGCGSAANSTAASQAPASQAAPAKAEPTAEPEPEVQIREEEMSAQNGDKNIYGVMYLPAEEKDSYPTVIMSHGFGGMYSDNKIYAETFAKAGYACYTFDYCGGGRGSKSDGTMLEMSVLTEAGDLSAVMDMVEGLDYVDKSQLYLFGQSQGGFVTTYVGAERADEVKAMILLFPAYSIPEGCWERHGSIENVPETESIMNNTLSSIYSKDAMSIEIYDAMKNYTGPVLLMHGDQDDVVPLSYSEKADETFENSELIVLKGTGHGFSARQKEAAGLALEWLQAH